MWLNLIKSAIIDAYKFPRLQNKGKVNVTSPPDQK